MSSLDVAVTPTPTKYIVSANYRDRTSKFRWLVRKDSDPVEAAIPCVRVIATGVVFRPSNRIEEGFGCKIVAHCDSVNTSPEIPDFNRLQAQWAYTATPLSFDGDHFTVPHTVTKVEAVELCRDGSMFVSVPHVEVELTECKIELSICRAELEKCKLLLEFYNSANTVRA